MKLILIVVMTASLIVGCNNNQKPKLRQGDFYTEAQGKEELAKLETMYTNKEQWEERKKLLREQILKGLNLSPMPVKTPVNAVVSDKRIYDGYSVENVYFESMPGYYVCGNLYRPLNNVAKHPVVLCPHGHFEGDSLAEWGRFRFDQQKRCATFARMGALVYSYSMFAWGGESIKQIDTACVIEKPSREIFEKWHNFPIALSMQTLNSIRALDFIETLPDADASKIAITGASGGGTQTFLLAAIDDRVSISVPVVMVSCHFFGGCGCESGMPIHESAKHFTNNAEIAAMIAPKPMLLVSDGDDWTKNEPTVEYPFIKRTYSFYSAENNVEQAHFPNAVHNYNAEKRVPVYSFLAKHMGLNLQAVTNTQGVVDETNSIFENAELMLSFSSKKPFPANALMGREAIEKAFNNLERSK